MQLLRLAPPLAAMLLAAPALANDSEAALGIGGIELRQNDAVSMDAEDLFISKDEVRVRYRFTNRTDRDVEVLVTFPLPPVRAEDEAVYGDRAVPDFTRLDFHTAVDGKPVRLDLVKRAELAGKDVTARLTQLGWPAEWIDGTGSEPDFVKPLTPAERAAFVREGLLRVIPGSAKTHLPAWDLVTHVTRRQLFPARRTVEVTHRYRPMVGGSVGGMLDPAMRKAYPNHARKYCADKAFFAALDRKQTARRKANEEFASYGEIWISYVLSSGRNWKGPIKDFRLVVDKGRPENLVSFCMSGVKKIGPTRFEVRKTNFEPRGDLDVLIAEWGQQE